MEEVCGPQGRLCWKINIDLIRPLHHNQTRNCSAHPRIQLSEPKFDWNCYKMSKDVQSNSSMIQYIFHTNFSFLNLRCVIRSKKKKKVLHFNSEIKSSLLPPPPPQKKESKCIKCNVTIEKFSLIVHFYLVCTTWSSTFCQNNFFSQ